MFFLIYFSKMTYPYRIHLGNMYLQPAIYPLEKGGHVTPPVAIDSQLGNVIQGRKGSPAVTVTQIVERVEKDGGNARSMAVWRCLSSGLDIENYKT